MYFLRLKAAKPLLISLTFHVSVLLLLLVILRVPRLPMRAATQILVEVEEATSHGTSSRTSPQYDLRPGFSRGGLNGLIARAPIPPNSQESFEEEDYGGGTGENRHAKDLLQTEGKVSGTLDMLAFRISNRLKYPEMLVENRTEGYVTLDLYFNSQGRVDEDRSYLSGSSRVLRGLFVQAAREGIPEWFANDAYRITREQLRNQHFRAEFLLSYGNLAESEIRKVSPGNYMLIKRGYPNGKSHATCLAPGPTGIPNLDLTCIAMRFSGKLKRAVSGDYQMRLQALFDRYEAMDLVGLRGINGLIRKS